MAEFRRGWRRDKGEIDITLNGCYYEEDRAGVSWMWLLSHTKWKLNIYLIFHWSSGLYWICDLIRIVTIIFSRVIPFSYSSGSEISDVAIWYQTIVTTHYLSLGKMVVVMFKVAKVDEVTAHRTIVFNTYKVWGKQLSIIQHTSIHYTNNREIVPKVFKSENTVVITNTSVKMSNKIRIWRVMLFSTVLWLGVGRGKKVVGLTQLEKCLTNSLFRAVRQNPLSTFTLCWRERE